MRTRAQVPLATAVAAVAAATLVAACGGGAPSTGERTTPPGRAETPGAASPTGTASSPATGHTRPVAIYYLHDSDRGPRLYREFHSRPATASMTAPVIRDAVDAMLHDKPHDPDYQSLWPRDTQVRGVRVSGDAATVDLSGAAKRGNAGAESEAMSLQQLVYTVTGAAPAVKRVRLLVDGAPVESLWGHMGVGTQALTRAPQTDALGPVWLESPAQGATTGRTMRLAGQATVFEATVSWEILRGDSVVKRGFTNATVGAPGRGPFQTTVTLPPGTYLARAFESSAKDGKPMFVDDKEFTVR
ncbi:MAG TPA: Gmad2 immunoglobulin-like domain-containing protein [Mycobacteriales bacterium]|nr:Gmad2 immunoglobulin-like domain-containing protein [Mycobacteriales bacterium]